MSSVEYIPLDMYEGIGGSKKIAAILANKNVLIGLAFLVAIIIIFVTKKKSSSSKSTKKSTTTSNKVTINKRIEANGEVIITKKVNGEEVKLTEEDLKNIEEAENKASSIAKNAGKEAIAKANEMTSKIKSN